MIKLRQNRVYISGITIIIDSLATYRPELTDSVTVDLEKN